jgi:hypothetical protein
MTALHMKVSAAERSWNFTVPRYAPCPGVGVAASYSIHVTATVEAAKLLGLNVAVSSAAFHSGNEPTVSATLTIRDETGKALGTIALKSAWFDVLRAESDSGISLYLPPAKSPPDKDTPQQTYDLPVRGSALLSVSAVINAGGGACPLGGADEVLRF